MLQIFRTFLRTLPVVMAVATSASHAMDSADPSYLPPQGSGKLAAVLSGDSLHVSMFGSTYILKIRHIMAPIGPASRMEYGQPGSMAAQLELDRLCRSVGEGQVHYDAVEQGNGYLMADVTCAGVNVATYQLEKGHAWAKPDAPAAFKALQGYAKSNKVGLWEHSSMTPIAPWDWQSQTPEAVELFKQELEARDGAPSL
jgi:endonuclease YncB( thermonuclease family)